MVHFVFMSNCASYSTTFLNIHIVPRHNISDKQKWHMTVVSVASSPNIILNFLSTDGQNNFEGGLFRLLVIRIQPGLTYYVFTTPSPSVRNPIRHRHSLRRTCVSPCTVPCVHRLSVYLSANHLYTSADRVDRTKANWIAWIVRQKRLAPVVTGLRRRLPLAIG